MPWFLIALVAPALWSATNYLDKILISRYFKASNSTGALILFSGLITLFVLPIILIIEPDVLQVATRDQGILIISGVLYILGLIPYFIALQKEDASIIVPLFQLVPVFSYVLAAIFLQESLNTMQLLGSVIIIISAVGISLDLTELASRKIKIKRAVLALMIASSLMIALDSLLFKFAALENQNFASSNFWKYSGYLLASIIILIFVPNYRRAFLNVLSENKAKVILINGVNEIVGICARVAFDFASLLAPLTLVWVVNGFQPLFVFMYGVILTLLLPKLIKEDISKSTILQKLVFILLILFGSTLLTG